MKRVPAWVVMLFPAFSMGQSTLPVWVPGSSQKVCQLIGETDFQSKQPTVSQTETNYGLYLNDLGYSFRHNGKLWFLFGDTLPTPTFSGKPNLQADPPRTPSNNDAIGFSSSTNIEQCLKLDFVRDSIGAYKNPQVLNAQGTSAITLGDFEVPIAGIDEGGTMYVIFGTEATNPFSTRSVVAMSSDDGVTYHYLYDFSAPPCSRCEGAKFVNVAIGSGADGYLYFWGSQGGAAYRHSQVFLARKQAGTMATSSSMQYFSGFAKDGTTPQWSASESGAIGLFQDYDGNPPAPSNCTGELGVEFNQFVNQWVLLYNCLNATSMNLNGIYMRFAPQPWGPWSAPQTIFNEQRDNGLCHFIHRAVTPQQPACDTVGNPGREGTQGGGYGPYFISPFTTGNAATATSTFYYTLSTWNPYVQVIMKSMIQAPNAVVVNAASFDSSPLSTGEIATLFGSGLSDSTASAPSASLPTNLAGVTVTIQDSAGTNQTAPLYYVSSGQISFVIPANLANGSATVSVLKNSSLVGISVIQLATVAPALFTANANGKGVAAAYFATSANPVIFTFTCGNTAGSCVSAAPGGAVLVLYGTGFRNNRGLGAVNVAIGGISASAIYAGPQNQYPGLDQINVQIPRGLEGKGEVDVVVSVNGKAANPVRVAFK